MTIFIFAVFYQTDLQKFDILLTCFGVFGSLHYS